MIGTRLRRRRHTHRQNHCQGATLTHHVRSKLAKGEADAPEAVDSDDEEENVGGSANSQATTTNDATKEDLESHSTATKVETRAPQQPAQTSKKAQSDFEKAFAKNKFNNAIANPGSSSGALPPKTKGSTPSHKVHYTDSSFETTVELPGVKRFSDVELMVSRTELTLEGKGGEEGTWKLGVVWKHEIDEDTVKAKFR